jgi:hypothetical protein
MVLSVDFDGSLVSDNPLRWQPGAYEAITRLAAAGNTLILHSSRNAPLDPQDPDDARRDAELYYASGRVNDDVLEQWRRFDDMRAFLKEAQVWQLFTVWQSPGKPHADVYIDDLAEPPKWSSIVREFAA